MQNLFLNYQKCNNLSILQIAGMNKGLIVVLDLHSDLVLKLYNLFLTGNLRQTIEVLSKGWEKDYFQAWLKRLARDVSDENSF